MGLSRECIDGEQPEPEGIRQDRGMADRANVASANSFADMTEPTA